MIRYKVVRESRRSCFAKGVYRFQYLKNDIIQADPDTHGIMVFDTYDNANDFRNNHPMFCDHILKVSPIGKGKRVKYLSTGQHEFEIRKFYLKKIWNFVRKRMSTPKGTICYPAVKVLE